jgi:hypothetical protein
VYAMRCAPAMAMPDDWKDRIEEDMRTRG